MSGRRPELVLVPRRSSGGVGLKVDRTYELIYHHPYGGNLEKITGIVKSLHPQLIRVMESDGRTRYLRPSQIRKHTKKAAR